MNGDGTMKNAANNFGLIESASLSRACREQGRQAKDEGSCPWGKGDVRRVWWMEGFRKEA